MILTGEKPRLVSTLALHTFPLCLYLVATGKVPGYSNGNSTCLITAMSLLVQFQLATCGACLTPVSLLDQPQLNPVYLFSWSHEEQATSWSDIEHTV